MGKRVPKKGKAQTKDKTPKSRPTREPDWKKLPLDRIRILLELELVDSEPEIWRVFHVPGDIPLSRLHDVIQLVMGWIDTHLHVFRFGTQEYSAHFVDEENLGADESDVRLGDLVRKEGAVFDYIYDLGDDWEHRLKVAGIREAEEGDITAFPVICLDGEGACPPEEVGGVHGYAAFCSALAGGPCEERDERLGWYESFGFYPTPFDPNRFPLEEVNLAIARFLTHIRVEPLEWCGEL